MKIHNVIEGTTEEWVLDPARGAIKEQRRALKPSDADRIVVAKGAHDSCPEGAAFERQSDGTFEVPDDVAAHFLVMPGWHEGASPFPPPEMVKEWEEREPVISKVGTRG